MAARGSTRSQDMGSPEKGRESTMQDEIHDTTPDDLKNFCATQACAQPKDVVSLAEATLHTLSLLWDEIGYVQHERDNATAEMFADIKRVFENKLSSTQEVKCSLNNQIRLAKARISTVESELGEAEDHGKTNNDACHLREVLATYKGRLDVLERKKEERGGVLERRAEALAVLYQELDDELSADQAKFLKIGSDFTLHRIEQFEAHIREGEEEKARRIAAMSELVCMIAALWDELHLSEEERGQDETDRRIKEGGAWRLTLASLDALKRRHAVFEEERVRRQRESQGSFAALERLWERIKTPVEERQIIRETMGDLSRASLECLAKEITRLEAVKKERMRDLVTDARGVLSELWDAMRLSADERAEFSAAFQEVYTDDSLQLHEEEIERCKERYEAMAPLIKMADRRDAIREEEAAMQEAQSDPARLLGRGRGMAERLKQEEKVRNMVSKELPRLTERLHAAAIDFEDAHGVEFRLHGERVLDILAEESAAADLAKASRAVRKGGPPPSESRPRTPAGSERSSCASAASGGTPSKLRAAAHAVIAGGAGGTPSGLRTAAHAVISGGGSTASTPGGTPSKLKAAAHAVISASKLRTPMGLAQGRGETPSSGASQGKVQVKGLENEHPQGGNYPPTRLPTPKTKLTYEPQVTHVISPRSGIPKRMIIPMSDAK